MEKVSVNRGALAGLVAVAALSLLAVAYLLGRASSSANAPATAAHAAPAGDALSSVSVTRSAEPRTLPTPGLAPEAQPAAEPASLPGTSRAAAPVPEPYAPPHLSPSPVSAAPAPAATDPERAAVAAYLNAVDRIQPAEIGGTAESAANELAAALAKGDTSGLDAMIRDSEAAKAKLAAVVPPAPCAAHYRESAASLDDGLAMLKALKSAVESPDPVGALAAVGSRATELRSRAEALQREDAALRQRYGLAR
ncbi:MAG: hypothetical protein U0529_21160 [Thermoanaerobaculia bacterium]